MTTCLKSKLENIAPNIFLLQPIAPLAQIIIVGVAGRLAMVLSVQQKIN